MKLLYSLLYIFLINSSFLFTHNRIYTTTEGDSPVSGFHQQMLASCDLLVGDYVRNDGAFSPTTNDTACRNYAERPDNTWSFKDGNSTAYYFADSCNDKGGGYHEFFGHTYSSFKCRWSKFCDLPSGYKSLKTYSSEKLSQCQSDKNSLINSGVDAADVSCFSCGASTPIELIITTLHDPCPDTSYFDDKLQTCVLTPSPCPEHSYLGGKKCHCNPGFDLENGICVGPPPPPPECAANQVLNSSSTTCVYPALLSTNKGDPNDTITATNHIYHYAGGLTQICDPTDGTCATYTKSGTMTANIPIDGTIYNTLDDAQNFRLLQIGSSTIAAVAGTIAVVGSGGLLSPAVTATAGTSYVVGGLGLTASALAGSTPYISNDPINNNTSNNGIKINLADYDFTSQSSSVSNSTDDNGNTVSTSSSQDGSTQSITFTPTDIVSTTTKKDGTVETVSIPNEAITTPTNTNDLSSTNNLPNIEYTVTTTTPTKTNNDGTQTSTNTKVTTKTLNSNTNTSSEVSNTYTVAPIISPTAINTSSVSDTSSTSNTTTSGVSDANTSTNSSTTTQDGTIDLAPITRRLDQMIRQNTVRNNKMDNLNKETTQQKILESIKDLVDKQPSKDDMSQAFKDAIKEQNNTKLSKQDISDAFLDALNRHDSNATGDNNSSTPGDTNSTGDNNSSTPGDTNSTGDNNSSTPGDTNSTGDNNSTTPGENNISLPDAIDYNQSMSATLAEVENAIAGQYGNTFNIFDNTGSCGNPGFAASVQVMGAEVKNPLKVADDAMNEAGVYPIIKGIFLFAATFLGLMSLFRR